MGCMVTMAPLLLEVPWDADWTTSDYNCISRNVNACLQRLELHRRATHATLCRLQHEQRWKMGTSCWSVGAPFHRNMAVGEAHSQRSFPCWRRRSSLRSIVRAR